MDIVGLGVGKKKNVLLNRPVLYTARSQLCKDDLNKAK